MSGKTNMKNHKTASQLANAEPKLLTIAAFLAHTLHVHCGALPAAVTAVNDDIRTGCIIRCRRSQIDYRPLKVFGGSHPSQGDLFQPFGEYRFALRSFQELVNQGGFGIAGTDAVYPDVFTGPLGGETPGLMIFP